MEMKKWIILLTLFFAVEAVHAQAQVVSLEKSIKALMHEYAAIGVSVAVVRNDSIVYTRAFGYRNREDSIPLQPDDLFRIASVSKTFVATAIMQLVERGKLSLDDDVNRYLAFRIQHPKYPDTPITIKMLLCHRSSINDSQGRATFDRINPDTNPDYAKCYCDYAPGEGYTYCNINYSLLGAVIENVSGERFDKYIRQYIIKPLGLQGSFNSKDMDSTHFVSPYLYRKKTDSLFRVKNIYQPVGEIKKYKKGYSTILFSPAGGMIITPEELARYMVMHINQGRYGKTSVISHQSEQAMREVQTPKTSYALSLKHYDYIIPGEHLIGQTGGAHGIHTAMIFHPEKKYGFVVFCNGCKSKSINGHELNYEIIKSLYDSIIKDF